ncbi:MAG: ParB/RepB/Spo0J family partition protein [Pseudomonadota bacterium]
MAAKKKSRLGKGLGALLGDVKQTTSPEGVKTAASQSDTDSTPSTPQTGSTSALKSISIELLQRGQYQPRMQMDKAALQELADSISKQGVIQPLLVRPTGKGEFEIIAGERRWRGAQLAGLTEVPAVVRDMPDQTAMAVALIENIQRQDLNAIEEAKGFSRLLDEFGLTHQEIAESVGRSRVAVSNLLRLLNLHSTVQGMVEKGDIEMGHARSLLSLPENDQPTAARQIAGAGMSVRQAETLVKRLLKGGNDKKSDSAKTKSADIEHLEDELSKKIGASVTIQHGNKKGKLIIQYHSLDELDGILSRIR